MRARPENFLFRLTLFFTNSFIFKNYQIERKKIRAMDMNEEKCDDLFNSNRMRSYLSINRRFCRYVI